MKPQGTGVFLARGPVCSPRLSPGPALSAKRGWCSGRDRRHLAGTAVAVSELLSPQTKLPKLGVWQFSFRSQGLVVFCF